MGKMAFSVTDKMEQRRKAMMMTIAQEEMRVMQQQSSIRNAALLQRLQDLEEKMKESSLKTERLKLLREEAHKEAREASQNSKPPIPRKKRQVNFGLPLTSTPYKTQPLMRAPEDTNIRILHLDQRAAPYRDIFMRQGINRNSNTASMDPRNHMRGLQNFSAINDHKSVMENLKSTKSSPIHFCVGEDNSESYFDSLRFTPRASKMSPDFIANHEYASYEPNSEHMEDLHESTKVTLLKESSSEHQVSSDEEYTNEWVETAGDAKKTASMDILEDKEMSEKAEIVSNEEILTKPKLPDTMEVPSRAMQGNPPAEEASVDMLTETHIEAETLTVRKNSNETETNDGSKLPDNNKATEIVTYSAVPVINDITETAKEEKSSEIQEGRTEMSIEEENSKIHKITDQLDVLSTHEPIESDKSAEPEILTKTEGVEDVVDEKWGDQKCTFEEEALENTSVSVTATKAEDIMHIPESNESSRKSEIESKQQSFNKSENVQNSENENQEEKKTTDFLSFLSSDDDDDEEDSFFDSIPKPHSSVVQERMPDPQVKLNEAMKIEETPDPLSDEVDSEIDQQLANLVTPTVPIRFVEHEMAQSEQNLQKEESTPSEIPQKDRTTKDANSERSTESGFTSQSNQKLHQKLALHLGLNTKTTFKTSEPDLKKTEDQVEEDDFDFYD